MHKYSIPKGLEEEYDHKLQIWLDNGWLQSYPEKELDASRVLILLMAVVQKNESLILAALYYWGIK